MWYFIGGIFVGMIAMFGILLGCAYVSMKKKRKALESVLSNSGVKK